MRATCWGMMLVGLLMIGLGDALGQSCGDVYADAGYGPYDYRNPVHRAENLPVVARAHFTRKVEALQEGQSGPLGGDIAYTLRAFPNHHGALAAMARLFVRYEGQQPPSVRYSMSCWFQKARQFAPGDGMVAMVEGVYLQDMGRPVEALKKLQEAARLEPDNPNIRYNLGLAYVRRGDLDSAVEQAKAAYGAGFPLPGLKDLLAAKGAWPPDN